MVQMANAMANGLRWCGHVLRRDDGHVLRKALEFEGQEEEWELERLLLEWGKSGHPHLWG